VYLGSGAVSLFFTFLVIVFRPVGTGGIAVSGISKIPWFGAFIGLIAGVGILVGGLMKFKEQRY
jgi:hypothetical protein